MTGTIVVLMVVISPGIGLGREAFYYVYNIINKYGFKLLLIEKQ